MIKLIITLIFFVSSLAGGVYLIYPLYEDYELQIQENEVLKEELDHLMIYVAELKKIEREIERNKEDLDVIKSAFPPDHDAPALFLYLEKIVRENNLEIEGDFGEFIVRPYISNGNEHSRIKEVSFNFRLDGDYRDIKNFLRETENVVRIIETRNIYISSDDPFRGSGGGEGLLLEIEGVAYSY